MAKRRRSKNGKAAGKKVAGKNSKVLRDGRASKYSKIVAGSALSGRGKSSGSVSVEAKEFSNRFNERYRDTLRDLSKR